MFAMHFSGSGVAAQRSRAVSKCARWRLLISIIFPFRVSMRSSSFVLRSSMRSFRVSALAFVSADAETVVSLSVVSLSVLLELSASTSAPIRASARILSAKTADEKILTINRLNTLKTSVFLMGMTSKPLYFSIKCFGEDGGKRGDGKPPSEPAKL